MGKHQKQNSSEFKQDPVNHYLSSGKSMEKANDLKISKSSLLE